MALKPTEAGQHTATPPPPKPAAKKPAAPAVVPGLGRALTPAEAQWIRASAVASAPALNGIPLDAASMIRQLPPEVQGIFHDAAQAAASGSAWTADQFQSRLVGTQWWQHTSDTARQYTWTKIIDPAAAQQQWNQTAFKVMQQFQQLGITGKSLAQAGHLADQAIMGGWSDAQLQWAIANQPGAGYGPGAVNTAMAQVHKTAQDYGITISNQAAQHWGVQIAGGMKDTNAFEDYARYQAMLNHPYWARQLETGSTTRQLADPWIQQAAQTLEISPDSIDITNPKWQFTTKDAHGNATPMSVAQWHVHLMQDPQYGWDHTQNAKDAAFGIVDQIQTAFGAR